MNLEILINIFFVIFWVSFSVCSYAGAELYLHQNKASNEVINVQNILIFLHLSSIKSDLFQDLYFSVFNLTFYQLLFGTVFYICTCDFKARDVRKLPILTGTCHALGTLLINISIGVSSWKLCYIAKLCEPLITSLVLNRYGTVR